MASTERARSGAQPKTRTFTNSKFTIVAEYCDDGRVVLVSQTSMGRNVSQPFPNEQLFEEWLTSFGIKHGYREVASTDAPPPSTPSPARAGAALFSDAQYAVLVMKYENWHRRYGHLYRGPDDPDFRRAFRAHFGLNWSAWERELDRRAEAEAPDVREDLMRQYEAAIDAAIAEEESESQIDATLALAHADERRKRAEEGAQRMASLSRGDDDAA